MVRFGSNIKILVNLGPGVYKFNRESGLGKTRLCKLLITMYCLGEPVFGYSYSEYTVGTKIPNPDGLKLLVIDRYDLYDKDEAFAQEINRVAESGAVVLVDRKSSRPGLIGYEAVVNVDMTEDCIEVHE